MTAPASLIRSDRGERLRLQRAIIFARDMKRLTEFYRDAAGLPVASGTVEEGWVVLGAGEASVALHAIPAAIASGIEIADPPRRREEAAVKLVFEVDALEAAGARLLAHGGSLSERRSWGAYDVTDPEGNIFQIVGASGSGGGT
jgi:catechol 2,3-dioxygenase-like lactoylglutathione lyase family enzyme